MVSSFFLGRFGGEDDDDLLVLLDMGALKRQIVQTKHGTISFLQTGAEHAKVVVFLHGIAGNAESFSKQLSGLPSYRVLAWDAPGYGETSAIQHPSMKSYAEILMSLLQVLDIPRISLLVGHSMGGICAQAFAGYYPDSVERLVISSSYAGDALSCTKPLAEKWTERLRDLETMPALEFGVARARGMLTGSRFAARLEKEVAEIAAKVTKAGLEGGCWLLHSADTRPFSRKYDMPVLLIVGEMDRVITPEKTVLLGKLIKRSRVAYLKDVSHVAYLEVPDQYNRILVDFLQE